LSSRASGVDSGTAWPAILALPRDADASRLPETPAHAWSRFVDAAVDHGLASLLAWRLRAHAMWEQVPEAERERLHRVELADAMATLRRRSCLIRVLDALGRESIIPLAYKGAALAYFAYPDPVTRPMVDIDLRVEPSDMPRAVAAMESIGFTRVRSRDSRPDALQALLEGEVKMRHPDLGTVELHWGVFPGLWLDVASRIDRAAVAARCFDASLLGSGIRLLAPRDHLVQVALHAAVSNRHHQAGLRGLLDIALIADQVDDWQEATQDHRRWRIARVMAHCLQMAGTLFDRPALLEASGRLQRDGTTALLRRHVDTRDVLEARRTLGPVSRWSFLVCAVDAPLDGLRLCGRALWPSRAWMQARYAGAGVRQRLGHLAACLRGDLD
jgi:hypothetical protein